MPIRWIEPEASPVPDLLQETVGGHPLVSQTLARRGITSPSKAKSFLNPQYYKPSPPPALPGLTLAADRLRSAIRAGEIILVWGDFDVDGQTATTLLVEALQGLGAQVRYHIPVRATEGHGIQPEVLTSHIQSHITTSQTATPKTQSPTILLIPIPSFHTIE